MEFVPKNTILEIAPNSIEYIRTQYGLEGPGRMKEAIKILQDWIEKQEHFRKKDFDLFYLETTIFGCKGSIERAKARLEKICTLRSVLPHLFDMSNVAISKEKASIVVLPKHTDEHYRVCLIKLYPGTYTFIDIRNLFRVGIALAEYEKIHDYVNGFILLLDLSGVNLLELLSSLNIIELKQYSSIFLEGYGMRLRALHVINESKLVNKLIVIIKQLFSSKLAERVYVNKSVDDLQQVLPRGILPKDYGGEDLSIEDLQKKWYEVIFSKDHMDYLRDMNEATTDEARRPRAEVVGQCHGVPGTFKLLHID